ncbi:uncharacterized protein LOC117316544 [Pecten maximus]|uniref:uncharacterized protein LOC117316544 n=1 Tax=Pecten maximus TaxID=6579 RepID=UPI001458D227|nr:uncharacterized protein LOC117316544 [Pecten maximus]
MNTGERHSWRNSLHFNSGNTFQGNIRNNLNTGNSIQPWFNNGDWSLNTGSKFNTLFSTGSINPFLNNDRDVPTSGNTETKSQTQLAPGRNNSSNFIVKNNITPIDISQHGRNIENQLYSKLDFLDSSEGGNVDLGVKQFSAFGFPLESKPPSLPFDTKKNQVDTLLKLRATQINQFAVPKDSNHFGSTELLDGTVSGTTDPTSLPKGSGSPDMTQITAAEFGNASPDMTQITAAEFGNASPDMTQITAAEFGNASPDMSQITAAEFGNASPDMTQITAAEFGNASPDMSQITAAEFGNASPDMTQITAAEFGNASPDMTQITAAEFGNASPDMTQITAAEFGNASPDMTQITAAEFGNASPGMPQITAAEFGNASPDMTQITAAEFGNASPDMTQITAAEFGNASPGMPQITAAEFGNLAVLRGSNNFQVAGENARILSPSWLNQQAGDSFRNIPQPLRSLSRGVNVPITTKLPFRLESPHRSQPPFSAIPPRHPLNPTTAFDLMSNMAGPFHDPLMVFGLNKILDLDITDNTFFKAISNPISANEALQMRIHATPSINLMASSNDHTSPFLPPSPISPQNDIMNAPLITNNDIRTGPHLFQAPHDANARSANSVLPPGTLQFHAQHSGHFSRNPFLVNSNPVMTHSTSPPGVQFLSRTIPRMTENGFSRNLLQTHSLFDPVFGITFGDSHDPVVKKTRIHKESGDRNISLGEKMSKPVNIHTVSKPTNLTKMTSTKTSRQ